MRLFFINRIIFILIGIALVVKIASILLPPSLEELSKIDDWRLQEVISGDRIIVSKGNRKLVVSLCSIAVDYFEKRDESTQYIESSLQKGKLRIDFLNEDDNIFFADVFVQLKPDYQKEIYLNQEMVDEGVATIESSHHCPDTILSHRKK